jgi:ubiquitin C-terminal hydrolase
MDLPIPTDNACTVYDCFDKFVESEILSGDNAWYNDKTGEKEDVVKTLGFWNFPKILVITLKRFSPDGTRKMGNLITFPIQNLDLSKYVVGYKKNTYVYDLYGICNHMGGTQGGHYTSFIKNADGKDVLVNQVGCYGVNLGRIDFYFDSDVSKIASGKSIIV